MNTDIKSIKKVLIVGSGPVVIGQGAEFDCSAVEAIEAFHEEGVAVAVVNSNPASVMTDRDLADAVYIEPLNIDIVKRIIAIEMPDGILPTLGGDKGLEICLELYQNGFLTESGVELLAFNPDNVAAFRSRQDFKLFLESIGEPSAEACVVGSARAALAFADRVGYPVLLRPAYSRGDTSIMSCASPGELEREAQRQIDVSMLGRVLVEKSVYDWKELEYELVRDCAGNCVCVSSLENIDPVGIHAGDSMVVTPAQTLNDAENAMLRASALKILSKLDVVGSCNIQFALKPDGSEYAVLEVDPRVSRSSTLVSRATGYPIARVAAKLALGRKLFEIDNEITGCTTACSEPAIDYCVVKLPRWSFDSFGGGADRTLGASMSSTGEAIAIGTSFEQAFMKAVRSVYPSLDMPVTPRLASLSDDELTEVLLRSDSERIFAVCEAAGRGMDFGKLHALTKIDPWFLAKLKKLSDVAKELAGGADEELYIRARRSGFTDAAIDRLSAGRYTPVSFGFNMVDTCAAEFDALRPYFYSSADEDNEAAIFTDPAARGRKKVLVVCSGAAAVGSGSELDYCNVHAIKELRRLGCYVVTVNNNPDAVSADFRLSDRLYIEPVTPEEIENIISVERIWGVFVQFCGMENINRLMPTLSRLPVKIIGVNDALTEASGDREKLYAVFAEEGIPFTREEFFNSTVVEADVISDGRDFLIPGISEHVERSGIHSGDAIAVYPSLTLGGKIKDAIADIAGRIVSRFEVRGLINLKFKLYDNVLYVTDVCADKVHNIPFIGKATGIPIVAAAVGCMLGGSLEQAGLGTGLNPFAGRYAVRVPVFSFDRLSGADVLLGRSMKSTGEVLGLAPSFEDALLKGLSASGMRIKRSGGVLVTVRNSDKQEAVAVADKFSMLDFNIYATAGTARTLNSNCVAANSVRKLHEGSPHTIDLIDSGRVDYVISTSERDDASMTDAALIRRRAIERQIPTFTTLDTATALTRCLSGKRSLEDAELIDICAE